MNDYKGIYVGNATSGKNHFEDCGCYVTLLADIFASSLYYGIPLGNADKYSDPLALNAESNLFEKGSSDLKWNVFETLFGQEDVKWEYWTQKNQKPEGLYEKLVGYEHSDKAIMVMGVFDLSSQTEGISHHVVGLSGIPDADGHFHFLTPVSNGDFQRNINISDTNAYTLDNLVAIKENKGCNLFIRF